MKKQLQKNNWKGVAVMYVALGFCLIFSGCKPENKCREGGNTICYCSYPYCLHLQKDHLFEHGLTGDALSFGIGPVNETFEKGGKYYAHSYINCSITDIVLNDFYTKK